MSLDWDVSDVTDHQKLHEDDNEWSKTQAIIWNTIRIGIGEITDENWREFYARVALSDKIDGSMLVNYTLTPEDIKRRIGLRTNVFPMEAWNQWTKRYIGSRRDDFIRQTSGV